MENIQQFIIHHWELWLALFIILVLILVNEWFSKKRQAPQLSPTQVVQSINNDDATIIDLRDIEAYRQGHIIQALRATPEDFNQKKMDKYKNKSLILVCAKSQQSMLLAAKLQRDGFEQVAILQGGFAAWQEAGLPTVKGNK